jgi:hypothetical protein
MKSFARWYKDNRTYLLAWMMFAVSSAALLIGKMTGSDYAQICTFIAVMWGGKRSVQEWVKAKQVPVNGIANKP